MELIRIGDKVISKKKIYQLIDRILELRCLGYSQQETAKRIGTDRTLISRLENHGEIRKGNRIAVIGFPILNKEEILNILHKEGVEHCFLMNEAERWDFVKKKNGLELMNTIMQVIAKARTFDVVIIIGSNKWIKIGEALLDKEIIGLELGPSPIEEDKYVEPEKIIHILNTIK